MRSIKTFVSSVFVATALGSAGCGGGAQVAVQAPEPVVTAPTHVPRRGAGLQMSAELGQIDEAATAKAFDHAGTALKRCYTDGLARVEYLAGDVKFYLRVKADGHLRWGFVEQSTLGDRDTESCMLGVLTATQWPLPEGGEAEIHQGLGFDAPSDVRPPTSWSPDKLTAALNKKAGELAACKHGTGTYQLTAYVEPTKDAGRVQAVGAASPNEKAAADVDCLLGVIRTMKLPSPGSYAAKVAFSE
jgi:hypothetical protein